MSVPLYLLQKKVHDELKTKHELIRFKLLFNTAFTYHNRSGIEPTAKSQETCVNFVHSFPFFINNFTWHRTRILLAAVWVVVKSH